VRKLFFVKFKVNNKSMFSKSKNFIFQQKKRCIFEDGNEFLKKQQKLMN